MRIFKKILMPILAMMMSLSMFAGCGGDSGRKQPVYDPNSPDSLLVVVSNLGFGVEWAYDIAEAYMETHPGKSITVESTVTSGSLLSQIEAGSFVADIAMFNDNKLWTFWRSGLITQIDDVLESIPEGESQTVYEKTNRSLIDSYKVSNGHFYSVPWLNENLAIAYNETVLNTVLGAGNWTLPKTTYELFKICDEIKAKNHYPFVWSGSYLGSVSTTWNAQYNGLDAFKNYIDGYYFDEVANDWLLSDNSVQCVATNTGYFRALEVMSKIVKNYGHQYANNMTNIYAQAAWAGIPYASDQKLSAFTPIGDWVYEETKDYFDETQHQARFMRTPIISEIVETLDLYTDTGDLKSLNATKQADYDAKLNAIIDYVDNGETGSKPAGVSDSDLTRVREARQMITSKSQAQAVIPSISTKKELAKDFLVFMASDLAVNIFSKATSGFSPFVSTEGYKDITYNNNLFMDDVKDTLYNSSIRVISPYSDINRAGYFYPKFAIYTGGLVNNSPSQFLEKEVAIFQEEWDIIIQNAGLKEQVGKPRPN